MSPEFRLNTPSTQLGRTLRRRRRRVIAVLAVFAVLTLVLGGVIVWRTAADSVSINRTPPPNEYVVFFMDDLTAAEQISHLRRHPQAEFVQAGKLPGVAVIRIHGDVEIGLRGFRQDTAVFRVQKSVTGMICH